MLHIPPTNCLLLTAKQEPYKKAYLLTKNMEEFSGKSLEKRASRQKTIDRKGNRSRQKNKRGDSKVESNDSPVIPDRGETSDIPGLTSGALGQSSTNREHHIKTCLDPKYNITLGPTILTKTASCLSAD